MPAKKKTTTTQKHPRKKKAVAARTAKRAKRALGTKKASAGKSRTKRKLRKGPNTEITQEVLEFIRALDDYKREKNRPFPTWSEVLEVIKRLGYRRTRS